MFRFRLVSLFLVLSLGARLPAADTVTKLTLSSPLPYQVVQR